MSDDDWSPGAGNSSATISMDDSESDCIQTEQPKKSRRRTSSTKNKKKKLSDNDSSDNSPLNPRRRTSLRNKNKQPILDLAGSGSDSMHSSDNENKPIIINTIKPKKRNSNSKHTNNNDNDADNECDTPMKIDKKKKTRKRKSEQNESISAPPKKKRKTTNTNNSTKNKKNNKVKLKGDTAVESVRSKMLEMNRPHSKNSIRMEIGENIISVKECEKSLNELDKDGILVHREFGKKSKTKIYWPNQDMLEMDSGSDDDEEIARRIKELEMEKKKETGELKVLKRERNELEKEETDAELENRMNRTHSRFKLLGNKWKDMEEINEKGGRVRVSKDELNDKLLIFHKYGKGWKERMDVVYDMISQMFMDAKDKPDKLLTSKLGGETDKDNDVEWDTYKEMYKKSKRVVQQKKDAQKRNKRK